MNARQARSWAADSQGPWAVFRRWLRDTSAIPSQTIRPRISRQRLITHSTRRHRPPLAVLGITAYTIEAHGHQWLAETTRI